MMAAFDRPRKYQSDLRRFPLGSGEPRVWVSAYHPAEPVLHPTGNVGGLGHDLPSDRLGPTD
jgi:hypothetical protein